MVERCWRLGLLANKQVPHNLVLGVIKSRLPMPLSTIRLQSIIRSPERMCHHHVQGLLDDSFAINTCDVIIRLVQARLEFAISPQKWRARSRLTKLPLISPIGSGAATNAHWASAWLLYAGYTSFICTRLIQTMIAALAPLMKKGYPERCKTPQIIECCSWTAMLCIFRNARGLGKRRRS